MADRTPVGAQMQDQELSAFLVGNTITLNDNAGNAHLSYATDGRYVHRDAKGRSVGTYRIARNHVCVTFVSGHTRCDSYLRAQGTPSHYFENADGSVYPVIAVQPASPRLFARR